MTKNIVRLGSDSMELIPVRHQPERNKPRYVLDENIQTKYNFKLSPKYLPLRAVAWLGAPDWVVLERAKEMDLIVITPDKGLITRAIAEGQTIIYHTDWGDRFEVKGRLIERGSRIMKHYLSSKERRLNKLAKCQYVEYYFL